ncbi:MULTISPECIES: barstar family protein [Streptomyces]|uniref:Barstar family protein n=1 Tax=Streptomyces doudnae TaxID=3075536 RepID=A0ABD5EQY5_9ACTN|nr:MULTISPECIES: barstar family protein [unclassified Streptomyces]MDT0437108.1 barstar family protein [Streptomyces sp. DSM 41981]MYQ64128.1 hypothetical protein [Streptomyces sp. SID4950]SCD72305.1 Barstar (barnase inhibitor) [Streptomyces sp. SolWspMP-5a-2]
MTSPHSVTLDLHGVADKAEFMDRVARALALPDWFGRNWDALADSLADPGTWPGTAADDGLLIVVRGWRPYAQTRPDEWAIAQDVLAEAADRAPALDVMLALGHRVR